jgi:putative membrane protein
MMSMMGAGMFWMMLFWIVAIGLVIYAILLLITKVFSKKQEDPAMEILRERFARGEIDQEEFEEKKAALLKK